VIVLGGGARRWCARRDDPEVHVQADAADAVGFSRFSGYSFTESSLRFALCWSQVVRFSADSPLRAASYLERWRSGDGYVERQGTSSRHGFSILPTITRECDGDYAGSGRAVTFPWAVQRTRSLVPRATRSPELSA
jgi:hypothetical protein